MSHKYMKVEKIDHGTVIDHILPGKAFDVLRVLGMKNDRSMSILINSHYHKGGKKDILKIENAELSSEEASRVAKDKIFLGVLNRYAIKGVHRRIKGVFTRTIYNQACFFSIWQLKDIIRSLLGDVPISWRTVLQFSGSPRLITSKIEQFSLMQKCPFGAFIGMGVTLVPRFRTRPLTVPYKTKHTTGPVPG